MNVKSKFNDIKNNTNFGFHDSVLHELSLDFDKGILIIRIFFSRQKEEFDFDGVLKFFNVENFETSLPISVTKDTGDISWFNVSLDDGKNLFNLKLSYGQEVTFFSDSFEYSESRIG